MILKDILRPKSIHYYSALKNRSHMTVEQQDDYVTQFYGYIGEMQFVDLLRNINSVVLWDISLYHQYLKRAQFDVIVLYERKLIHYDVKNYKGHFHLQGNQLLEQYGKKLKQPDDQLFRAEEIMRKVFEEHGIPYEIESYVVFINKDFYLAGEHRPHWLTTGQLNRHLKRYMRTNHNIEENIEVGNFLMCQHDPKQNVNLPVKADINDIKRGIKCSECLQLQSVTYEKKKYHHCSACGKKFSMHSLLFHNLQELYYLKGEPFTLKEAVEWCDYPPRTSVHRILKKYFVKMGHTKGATYELKK